MADFRGASADALAARTDELRSVPSGELARVGGDLFAVAGILRDEPALRRVVTDVSVAPEAKQGLVRQILGGKVSDAALSLVANAVAQRWTVARDLADAVERLGEIAVVRSAGDDTARLEDELFAVGQVVKGAPELRDALSDPARSPEDKARLVDDLLAQKALPATVALVRQALAGTYRTVGVALATYERVAADVNGERVATVTVAKPLADADRARLVDVLSRQYSRPVHLNVVVDPSVVGGVLVEIGDDVIDGTVSGRLDTARRRLAG
ncbi:F0F1 ATP synthase subunit delta [Nocardioides zeae]|uniref:ATP synthase subunit delta n=1 Tax=Nocardioides imazamoxiresistens TaxID=3231893 RepID=A0ABU3Q0T0_9ACTN|nr:F0F1 ATP synthase subunit delta [Nocardioides zeae]MDT9595108.1 F0F1 ATP synthase subunit delta [Nocardioides zeae]